MTKTIDARGLSCPQPVILTRAAIKEAKDKTLTVQVDTMTQVYNVSRSAESLGWSAEHEKKDTEYLITLKK